MGKRRLKIQAVCGVGMGSCQLAKMSIEKVAKKMGIPVEVEAADASTAGGHVDIIATTPFLAAQLRHLNAKIVTFDNFVNEDHIRERIGPVLKELWEE